MQRTGKRSGQKSGRASGFARLPLKFRPSETGETVSFEAPIPEDMYHLLSVLRLEAGLDSSLSNEEEWQDKLGTDDDDDWNEDDYDVEVVYVRD